MINHETIPAAEQKDFIATFWALLRECEGKAKSENDPVLKLWVEATYLQWNRVTDSDLHPSWVNVRDVSAYTATLKIEKPLTFEQKQLLNTEFGLLK